jgi:hypothetical protein
MSTKITNFEKCLRLKRELLTRAGEIMTCTHWDGEYASGRLRQVPSQALQTFGTVDLGSLTADEMDQIGLQKTPECEARVIPIWLWAFLPEEIKDGSGEKTRVRLKAELDSDHRFGNTAHSIFPAETKEAE